MRVEQAFELAGVVLLFATLVVAATTDVLRRRVYSWTTLPAIALGLALGFGEGGLGETTTSPGLWSHLTGFAVGFGVFFVAYWIGGEHAGVGGGDVKLVAAVGAIQGFPFVLGAMFWGSLVGAIMAVWVLLWRGQLGTGLRRAARYALSLRQEPLPDDHPGKVKIPYGVAISFGTLVFWFMSIAEHP